MATSEQQTQQAPRVAGRINFNRTWEAGRLFWLPFKTQAGAVGLGITGANRAKSRTANAPEDLRVLAGMTDLDASLVTISDDSDRAVWSSDDTLIKQQFGQRLRSRNQLFYKPPFLLREDGHVKADVLPQGGELGGNLVFLCDPVEGRRQIVTIPESAYPFDLVTPINLAGGANELKPLETRPSQERHTLLWGAGSDLRAVSLRIRGAGEDTFMEDFVPIWAVCADPHEDSQIITQLWPRPYYLPPGASLKIEVLNPAAGMEANGHIYFKCARW